MQNLSIITITYNDPSGLARTIQSLLPLTRMKFSWEHVVVDQSPAQNKTILSSLPQAWPLKHVTSDPLGIYGAHNRGIESAQGSIFWFLNGGDAMLSSKSLEDAVESLLAEPEKSALIAPVQVSRDGKPLYSRAPYPSLWENIVGENRICHQAMLIRQGVFQSLGNYDRSLKVAADYDHLYRFHKANLNIIWFSKPFADFDMSGTSSNIDRAFSEFRMVQLKHAPDLPVRMRLANTLRFHLAYGKTRFLKALGGSRFRALLLPFWLAWNRRKPN